MIKETTHKHIYPRNSHDGLQTYTYFWIETAQIYKTVEGRRWGMEEDEWREGGRGRGPREKYFNNEERVRGLSMTFREEEKKEI